MQHIGRDDDAPPVTPNDIANLKPSIRCPVPWCTKRSSTKLEMRGHALSHSHSRKSIMDQDKLARGMILSVRGPPERRFYLVGWLGESTRPQWLDDKHFLDGTNCLIEAFFYVHSTVDRNSNLDVPGEYRCPQCNMFLLDPVALRVHVEAEHTFPVRPGTITHRKAMAAVQMRHHQTLPKVVLRNGETLDNKYKAKWLGMTLTAKGNDEEHVRHSILMGEIKFGEYREILRSKRLQRSIKVSVYKGVCLSKATYGCEVVSLTSRTLRRYKTFNARCSACVSGRSVQQELRKPSFDLLAWIRWRRLVWFGKCMRGTKGAIVLHTLQWNFNNRATGDIFHYLPAALPKTFHELRQKAMDINAWQQLCDEQKPPSWITVDAGVAAPRRSARLANKSGNDRALRREELKRRLAGTHAHKWPPPTDVAHGELHVYTDGSASGAAGDRKAGCGVWFADGSKFNISTSPGGRQTSNRAELTAVILALRKAKRWPTLYKRLTIHSDSRHCVDGTNKWLQMWKVDGWTRNGQPLRNLDLWKLLSRVLDEYQESGIEVALLHVPTHVGVYGNEKADRLAKAAVRRARRNALLTPAERAERNLEGMADAIVASVLANI